MKISPKKDDIIQANRERWNALARANVQYSRPFLDFTPEQAAEFVYHYSVLKDVRGKRVLCLASGGGQDSVAFGLLGAEVTVLDLSDVQLERDRQAASHHNLSVTTVRGDMRDLSAFPDAAFDVVWQNYSINFVPSVEPVFREVARVLKPDGIYYLAFANPYVQGVDDHGWNGESYPLKTLYLDGVDMTEIFPHWDVEQPDGATVRLTGPHEFRHTLSTVLNSLVGNGFIFMGLWEWKRDDENPVPGSWAHFTQVAPPYLMTFWNRK